MLWLNIFAPAYFLFFSSLRCYLESQVLAREHFFSYYTLFHHITWFVSLILLMIFLSHIILKVPINKLLWLMYGSTVMIIPLFYALITGEKMDIDYLHGSFRDIMIHILTFCWTFPRNNPLTMELIIIFLAMIGVGYFYTGSWLKALELAVSVHIAGNILAIYWFGVGPETRALIPVTTQLHNHPFLAIIYLHVMTFFVLISLYCSGLFSDSIKSWLISASWGFMGWVFYIIISYSTGFFTEYFDIIATALPAGTGVFLLVRFFLPDKRKVSLYTRAILAFIFLIQLAVMIPVYLHRKNVVFPGF